MSVYLIRAGVNGPVKIGHARNPEKRIAGFQTAHYERLTLLRTWPGGQPEEAALHRAFSDFRITGEWFHFCEAMLTADPATLVPAFNTQAASSDVANADPDALMMRRLLKHVGGLKRLGAIVGRDHSTVIKWKRVPLHHVAAIVAATKIPREELRPDVWGPDAASLCADATSAPQVAA